MRAFYATKDGAFIHLDNLVLKSRSEIEDLLTHNALRSFDASMSKLSNLALAERHRPDRSSALH